MKNQLNLSDRDKKLLFLLFSLIVIAGSYFFIYQKNMSKVNELTSANQELKSRVEELTSMQAQSGTKKAEIEQFKKQIEELEAKFPAAIKTEDTIIMLNDLETIADMSISSATFAMNEVFYPTGSDGQGTGTNPTTAAETQTQDAGTTNNEDQTQATETEGQAETSVTSDNGLIGYRSTITIAYQTTYAGLKKAIDFINQNPNRMTIGDLSAAYDTSTGNLMGNISIQMYSLAGTDKGYEAPYIKDINTGLSNIFGTVEIPNQ